MKLPIKLQIGDTAYKVMLTPDVSQNRLGVIYPGLHVLKIATHDRGKPRAAYGILGINETLWHEITHGILHDMGHPLWDDEVFVTEFSRRLALTIETAEF